MSGVAFQRLEAKGAVLWVDPEFAVPIEALGLLKRGAIETLLARQPPGPRGRAATAILALAGRPERVHLRPLRHGGWLAGLWGDRVAGLRRARAESEVTSSLRAAGAPVPRPAFVLGQRQGPLWRAAIGTVYEEDTLSGVEFLARASTRSERMRGARAAAGAIRRFHDAGGRHADLHIGNLIVRDVDDRIEVLIVDLDRARHTGAPSPDRRMRELMRLYRSLRKRSLRDGLATEPGRAEVAFFEAYVAGDRALRSALLRHLPREQRRITRHATAWRSTSR